MSTTNSTPVINTGASDDRYRAACQRLADRTAAICGRLEDELGRAQDELEIDWRALLASQREVAEQASKGAAPMAEIFWIHQAQPRAEELLSGCLSIIDAHLLLLWDALSSHWRSVAPLVVDERAQQLARDDVRRLVEPVRACGLDRARLDEVGERWQHRLRRQAIRRYVRTGGSTEDGFSAAIDAQELRMITQPPWAQADQLLSAFELVHADVRRAVIERVDRIVEDLLST